MIMEKLKLSIIIVNYHVKKELFNCITSILNSAQDVLLEIIVVDNDEKKIIKKELLKKFPKVNYIESPKNLGYGAGNNLGAKQARGDFLFILNPDTEIIEGNISTLIDFLRNNKKIGLVAPLLIDKNNNPYELQGTKELTPKRAIFSLSILSKIFPKNKIYNDYYNYSWNKSKSKEVDIVPGTAFIIKKLLFEEIGRFDENYFLYFEEFDLCRRLRKKGYKNYILPDLKVFHKWGASTVKNKLTKKYFLQSRFYYFRKNFGLIPAILTEIVLRISKLTILFLSLIIVVIIVIVSSYPKVLLIK
jgi:N-acetylglucosaminyl-diphospho-decaprenol L-rhamnosyltransferase